MVVTDLLLSGAILGLADGLLNPCALGVLFLLLSVLLKKKRSKVPIYGAAYALTIYFVYFSFMKVLFNLIIFVGYFHLVTKVVALILTFFGLLEVKDFWFYGRWFSLSLPRSSKPFLAYLLESANLFSILFLGIFVALAEIPCAGAFPLAYTTLLAKFGIENTSYYIALYNLFFVLPLLFLTLFIYILKLKVEKLEKKRKGYRRYLRLLTGVILFLLAGLLVDQLVLYIFLTLLILMSFWIFSKKKVMKRVASLKKLMECC